MLQPSSLALNWLEKYLIWKWKSVNATVRLYLWQAAIIQNMESSANWSFFSSISFPGVKLNLRGLEEKEKEHFPVNTGIVCFHQTGSFVMGEESF
jgi:hypothetical protein